eukprot:4310061-Lingulodinium_polyedra.AAC.1
MDPRVDLWPMPEGPSFESLDRSRTFDRTPAEFFVRKGVRSAPSEPISHQSVWVLLARRRFCHRSRVCRFLSPTAFREPGNGIGYT